MVVYCMIVDENAEISIKEAAELVVEAMNFTGPVIVSHCGVLVVCWVRSRSVPCSTTPLNQTDNSKRLQAMKNYGNTCLISSSRQ